MPESDSRTPDSLGGAPRPWYLEYGVPLLGTLVAALIVVMFQTAPVAPFMLAVIVAAWFGGTRAGLVAMGLAFIAIIPLVDGLRVTRLLFFVVISGCMIWVIASERRASASLRRTRDELQRQNDALNVEKVEAKALEELLRRNERELRLVIDTIPAMAWSLHADGRLEFLNQRWLDYSGMSLAEALERPADTMHPDDVPAAMERWRQALAAGSGYEEEMRIRRADGEYRWFLVRIVPLLDPEGKILRWYGTSTDIEDRKRAEQSARRSERELREVIETIPAIAWTTTPDGANDFINRSWEEYTGLSKADTAGDGWKRAVHPDDIAGHVERWQRSVASGEAFENEARYRRADGEYRWFLVRAVPLRDEAGQVSRWYGILADIQDRKVAEEAVRESAQRLQHLSRRLLEVQEEERRNLARELHDEFGQLIATANLHLHVARSGAGEAARAGLDNCAAILQQAGDHVRSLALELRPAMLETLGLDATLRWLARQQQEGTGIRTEVVGSVDEAAGDRAVACFRVAQEALTNVVKHAQARHAWIEVGEHEGRLELVVGDDGAGFDVASTLEQAAARGQLGLLGMRERVQILGGDLRIESQPGRGTHVQVSFPRT